MLQRSPRKITRFCVLLKRLRGGAARSYLAEKERKSGLERDFRDRKSGCANKLVKMPTHRELFLANAAQKCTPLGQMVPRKRMCWCVQGGRQGFLCDLGGRECCFAHGCRRAFAVVVSVRGVFHPNSRRLINVWKSGKGV